MGAGAAALLEARTSPRRRAANLTATILVWSALLVTLVPTVLVLFYVVKEGIGIFSWAFLTDDIPPLRSPGPGMGPAVIGTLIITGVATLIAVPLGLLGAIYLNEYGATNWLARLIRFMSNVMTGVPSVVMGMFIYTIWVLTFGQSGFAGSLALAALMLPIVIRSTEEMLRLVPDELRQASYALGARKSRTIIAVALPSALPGIVSGSLLAVARAAGETAPVLFVIGAVNAIDWNHAFLGPATTLSVQIYNNVANTAFDTAHQRAWGAALTLILIVAVFSLGARFVSGRFALARGG